MADNPVPVTKIKGDPVTLFPNPGYGAVSPAADKTSDGSVDCANYNAVSVTVYIPAGFTVTATVQGSPDPQGVYLTLPDAQATQAALTASKVFDVTVGQRFVKVKLSGITVPGGNPVNSGIVVIVTPYDAAGQANISIAATANQNLTDVGGAAITLGQKTTANSLPVALPSDQTVPVSAASLPLPTGAAQDGTDGAGAPAPVPSGGTGIRGWLASIVKVLQGTLTASVSNFPATQAISSADGAQVTVGTTTDTSAANTVIGRLKATVAALAGGLPAALSGSGNLKVAVAEALPAGTSTIGTVFGQAVQGTLTDRSGTITTGGTAQTLAAANAARKYLTIQNQHATEALWINFTTTAVAAEPSLQIPAGGGAFTMEAGFVSTELVSVIAATTGHPFSAKEG